MFLQNNYFNKQEKKQFEPQYKFTLKDEQYFSYGFQKYPQFYKKMKQKYLSAQYCIKCNNKELSELVNDDSILSAIIDYVEWCKNILISLSKNNLESKETYQYNIVEFMKVQHNDKRDYKDLKIQKFSVQGHNSSLRFQNCHIELLLIPFHNTKISLQNSTIKKFELSGFNSEIILSNSTTYQFYHEGLNTVIVFKNNSKIRSQFGKSYKKQIK